MPTEKDIVDVDLRCYYCNKEIMGKVFFDADDKRACYKCKKPLPRNHKVLKLNANMDVEKFTPGDVKLLVNFKGWGQHLRPERIVTIVSQIGERVTIREQDGHEHVVMTSNLKTTEHAKGRAIRPTNPNIVF